MLLYSKFVCTAVIIESSRRVNPSQPLQMYRRTIIETSETLCTSEENNSVSFNHESCETSHIESLKALRAISSCWSSVQSEQNITRAASLCMFAHTCLVNLAPFLQTLSEEPLTRWIFQRWTSVRCTARRKFGKTIYISPFLVRRVKWEWSHSYGTVTSFEFLDDPDSLLFAQFVDERPVSSALKTTRHTFGLEIHRGALQRANQPLRGWILTRFTFLH